MQSFHMNPLSTLLFAAAFVSASAIAADGESIMVHGGSNQAVLPCITCHGADGKGTPAAGFPRLAGLPADYIVKQLKDARTGGGRDIPIMRGTADALTDDEIVAVAKAYAALPKVNVTANPAERPVPGTGAWIALRGAWDRNIPECTLCHGPSGIGVGSTFPPLAGQSAMYLEAQLKAWKGSKAEKPAKRRGKQPAPVVATRHNDPNGLMQHIAADLTDAEIKAVADYFGSLGDATEAFDEAQHRLR